MAMLVVADSLDQVADTTHVSEIIAQQET